jgi:hypothetical protein
MRPHSAEFIAYLVGVVVLGLFYPQLKAAIPGPVLLGVAIAYLIMVRVVGHFIAKRVAKAAPSGQAGSDA